MRLLLILALLFLSACDSGPEAAQPADQVGAAAEEVLPPFPLPAPKPSVRANLPRTQFGQPATVGDVASKLEAALMASGYEDFSYYGVPGGFALATETERIHDDGRPYEGAARWTFEAAPLVDADALFSDFPRGFLDRLRSADPGRYRAIVFLVTTKLQTTDNAAVDLQGVAGWTSGGADRLPAAVRQIALGPDHNISVLVYEFRRASVAAEPELVSPSGLTVRAHMQATQLLRSN